jgi:anti-anti-sigma factor
MPEQAYTQLQVNTVNDVLVLTITAPELFADATAEGLRTELHAALDAYPPTKIVLDFRNVRFITTIAFQPLLSIRRKAHASGKHLLLCGLQPDVAEVFDVTRLISSKSGVLAAFDHEKDLPAALARLQRI